MTGIDHKIYMNDGNPEVLELVEQPGLVLDVGCGAGDNARYLKVKGCQVDGISISETELQEARKYLQSGYLFNLEEGLPDQVKINRYDVIICSHVLEHICYPEKVLDDIHHCLKKDGKLIVALPNLFHYKSRLQLIKGNFNYQDAGLWDNTHFKWYTYKTGQQLLEKNGFTVTKQFVSGDLPLNSFFSKIFPANFSAKLYNTLKKISLGLLGYQLVYEAKRS